jgi:NAD-dependent dihydropyrimidine dehydrogenase PreA subunit
MDLAEKYAQWKGIPREEIDWHPTIDEKKCTGCGMCITSCGRDVFDYDDSKNKSIVANPLHCMVGCTSCRTWCVFDAISFPDSQYVKDLIKKKKVLSLAKRQLKQKYNKDTISSKDSV